MRSTCLAVQREARDRGQSVMDRRAAEQAAAAVAEEQKKKRTLSTGSALEKVQSRMDRPSALRKLGRGRAAMNAPKISCTSRIVDLVAVAEPSQV